MISYHINQVPPPPPLVASARPLAQAAVVPPVDPRRVSQNEWRLVQAVRDSGTNLTLDRLIELLKQSAATPPSLEPAPAFLHGRSMSPARPARDPPSRLSSPTSTPSASRATPSRPSPVTPTSSSPSKAPRNLPSPIYTSEPFELTDADFTHPELRTLFVDQPERASWITEIRRLLTAESPENRPDFMRKQHVTWTMKQEARKSFKVGTVSLLRFQNGLSRTDRADLYGVPSPSLSRTRSLPRTPPPFCRPRPTSQLLSPERSSGIGPTSGPG